MVCLHGRPPAGQWHHLLPQIARHTLVQAVGLTDLKSLNRKKYNHIIYHEIHEKAEKRSHLRCIFYLDVAVALWDLPSALGKSKPVLEFEQGACLACFVKGVLWCCVQNGLWKARREAEGLVGKALQESQGPGSGNEDLEPDLFGSQNRWDLFIDCMRNIEQRGAGYGPGCWFEHGGSSATIC